MYIIYSKVNTLGNVCLFVNKRNGIIESYQNNELIIPKLKETKLKPCY